MLCKCWRICGSGLHSRLWLLWYGIYGMIYMVWYIWYGIYGMVYMVWCIWYGRYGMVCMPPRAKGQLQTEIPCWQLRWGSNLCCWCTAWVHTGLFLSLSSLVPSPKAQEREFAKCDANRRAAGTLNEPCARWKRKHLPAYTGREKERHLMYLWPRLVQKAYRWGSNLHYMVLLVCIWYSGTSWAGK